MTTRHRTPHAADLDRVVARFDAFMHRIMATHAPELSAIELTMSQTKALYLVIAAGHLRMSELAAGLSVTSSTATGQVDRLVELGLVERKEEPADRRQVVITPTPAAIDLIEHLRELNSARMREILSRLHATDLPTIEHAIQLLDDAVAVDDPVPTHTQRGTRS